MISIQFNIVNLVVSLPALKHLQTIIGLALGYRNILSHHYISYEPTSGSLGTKLN